MLKYSYNVMSKRVKWRENTSSVVFYVHRDDERMEE